MTFDGFTSDAMQQAVRDALIGFMAASAQAQAEATKEAQRAGIAAAQKKAGKYNGRKPSYDLETAQNVLCRLQQGVSVSAIAKSTGLSRQTVLRIRANPQNALAAVERWSKSTV